MIEVDYEVDPNNKFPHLSRHDMYSTLGYLPGWVMNSEFFDKPLKEALDEQYCCGLFEMTGGVIDSNGVFRYPEDPELHPLIKIIRGKETFYQYQSAIVAIVQEDGSTFMTRMD